MVHAEKELNKTPPIPEFALDMHTARGKALYKGIDVFFAEDNKLENEAFNNPTPKKPKNFYGLRKKAPAIESTGWLVFRPAIFSM